MAAVVITCLRHKTTDKTIRFHLSIEIKLDPSLSIIRLRMNVTDKFRQTIDSYDKGSDHAKLIQ